MSYVAPSDIALASANAAATVQRRQQRNQQ